jgi:toxin YoeB
MIESPFDGFGSPEALKHELSGKWSRELSKKDRVVYSVEDEIIYVDSLLGHYKK